MAMAMAGDGSIQERKVVEARSVYTSCGSSLVSNLITHTHENAFASDDF